MLTFARTAHAGPRSNTTTSIERNRPLCRQVAAAHSNVPRPAIISAPSEPPWQMPLGNRAGASARVAEPCLITFHFGRIPVSDVSERPHVQARLKVAQPGDS